MEYLILCGIGIVVVYKLFRPDVPDTPAGNCGGVVIGFIGLLLILALGYVGVMLQVASW